MNQTQTSGQITLQCADPTNGGMMTATLTASGYYKLVRENSKLVTYVPPSYVEDGSWTPAPAGTPTPEPAEVTCHDCNNTGYTGWNHPCTSCDAFASVCDPKATIALARWNIARRRITRFAQATAAVAAIAPCLLTSQPASAASAPVGCTVIGVTSEQDEHFPLAHCTDGAYQYQDLDSGGAWKDARYYAVQRFSHH